MKKVQYDITTECNLDCDICYMALESTELVPEFIRADIQTHSPSTLITIGGGEPFLHNKLEEIITGILDHGNPIHLSTNATLIPNWFYQIEEEKRKKIIVQASLLAATRQKYSEICGQDYLDIAIRNISKLKNYYRTFIHSPIYRKNLGEVSNLIRLSQSLDIPLHLDLVIPIGRAKNVSLLNENDIQNLRDLLFPYNALGIVSTGILNSECICPILSKYYPFRLSSERKCPADNRLYIDPAGKIKNCVFGGG